MVAWEGGDVGRCSSSEAHPDVVQLSMIHPGPSRFFGPLDTRPRGLSGEEEGLDARSFRVVKTVVFPGEDADLAGELARVDFSGEPSDLFGEDVDADFAGDDGALGVEAAFPGDDETVL